jgi:hypothetical protein
MKSNMELNVFGGFACYSPELFSPSYINLMIFECDGLNSESPNSILEDIIFETSLDVKLLDNNIIKFVYILLSRYFV